MRMRCFLWPCSLPNDFICRCMSVVTLSHILNCKYFITYRSIVHDSLVFIAFPFSINGRLSVEAETFLDDFQKMVKEKTMKRFDIFLWRSRIQFAIINRLPRFFNRIREALARQQANQDFVEEILV
ncbi:hypothetical protein P9112_005518 [Eukaryota sp. TZLM1-RC]